LQVSELFPIFAADNLKQLQDEEVFHDNHRNASAFDGKC
jgi:hypothetical protein